MNALELEDTVKNYERRAATGWFVPDYSLHSVPIYVPGCLIMAIKVYILYFRKYVSTLRPAKAGKIGSLIDNIGKYHLYQLVCFLEFYGPV